jgi:hypothetical protein
MEPGDRGPPGGGGPVTAGRPPEDKLPGVCVVEQSLVGRSRFSPLPAPCCPSRLCRATSQWKRPAGLALLAVARWKFEDAASHGEILCIALRARHTRRESSSGSPAKPLASALTHAVDRRASRDRLDIASVTGDCHCPNARAPPLLRSPSE